MLCACTPFCRYTTVQLLLPSRRVLMEKRCHHVVIECLPLRMLGCLLPRTSQNPQKAKFAEFLFHALQSIGAGRSYEPPHFTLSTTFCAWGANSSNSLAGLKKPIVTVSPSRSSKTMTRTFSPSASKIGSPVLNLTRSTQFGWPTIVVHVPL